MRFISQFLIVALMTSTSLAAPMGGEVIRGGSDISYSSSRVEINQHTDRAVINWQSFDVKAGEHVKFNLPNPSSVALNRISDRKVSEINGLVSSNGNLILLNPNGIVFGKDAVVDAAGIIASSSKVNLDEFMNGGAFGFTSDGAGKIINKGKISSQDHGLVGLVSPHIENHGVISAKLGKVQIASSDSYTVDLAGDGLINLAISDHQKQKIENNGKINAYKGSILLTASAAREIIDSLIINNGKLEAKTGSIKLYAEGSNAVPDNVAANKGIKAGQSTIINNGIIDASGKLKGQKGGTIELLADDIALLDNSKIDASGNLGGLNTYQNNDKSDARLKAAGGDIKIGGDYLGSGTTPAAKNIYVAKNAKIYADSLDQGDAGRVIIWADNRNDFYGNVFVRGGKRSGDGGFVETSGKEKLNAKGYVTTLATKGKRGTYLLDPTSISIYGSTTGNWPKFVSTDSTINLNTNLALWLDASDTSNVQLTYNSLGTTATGTSGQNTITVSANTSLVVGARIRLGGAGSVTNASTLGSDTYTISGISGTTITLSSNLTANYTGSSIYQGYTSQLTDKSSSGLNGTQATASQMPLWISNGLNGIGTIKLDGSDDSLNNTTAPLASGTKAFTYFNIFNSLISTGCCQTVYQQEESTVVLGVRAALLLHNGYEFNGNANDFNFGSYSANTWYIGTITHINQASNNVRGTYGSVDITGSVTNNGIGASGGYSVGHKTPTNAEFLNGQVGESLVYNTNLSGNPFILVQQYQSSKWAIALNPLNNGHSEVVQAITDGAYSVFTTRYLERLAASADISLTAGSGGILLDLQGDTLTLPSEVNLSLTTTSNGNITSNSSGTISATRTSSKGNITLTAGGTGYVDLNTSGAVSLTSSGGDISLSAGNNIQLYNVSGKTITVNNNATATADVYLNGTVNATATSGNSIIIASGRNLINNVGNSIYTTAGTARYLVYSYSIANNTPSSTPGGATAVYSTTYPTVPGTAGNLYIYNSALPTFLTVTADNKFKFYNWPNPTFTYTVSGLPAGASPSIVSGVSFTSTAVTGSLPGIYSITPSGGTVSGAYTIGTYTPGTITVIKTPPSNKCPCLTALGR